MPARSRKRKPEDSRFYHRSCRVRLSHAALHHVAESVLRGVPASPITRVAAGRLGQRFARSDLWVGSAATLHVWCVGLVHQRATLPANLYVRTCAVLGEHAARRGHLSCVCHERSRAHLRHWLPAADAVRSPRTPCRDLDARGRRIRARLVWHSDLHAIEPRAAEGRPRAVARDSR